MTVLTKPSRTESTWVLTSCRFTAANTPLSPKFTSAAITQIASSVCLRSVQRHPSMKSSKNEVCADSAVASASGATAASDVQSACDAVSGRLLLRSVVTMSRTCSSTRSWAALTPLIAYISEATANGSHGATAYSTPPSGDPAMLTTESRP